MRKKIDPAGPEMRRAILMEMARRAMNGDVRAAKLLLEVQDATQTNDASNQNMIMLADLINNPADNVDIDDLMDELPKSTQK